MADAQAATEQALVRLGWEHLDLLNKLGSGQSQRLLARVWDAELQRARREISPLRTDSIMPTSILNMYQGPGNWTRFRRTLDYIRPGDRLFEIGLGYGYLAGLFNRDGEIDAYHGIDLVADNVTETGKVLELNGLGSASDVSHGDLYDLTRERLDSFGATMVVCCEVIEHVPDPELAIKTLADALPEDAELLISVPLLGRLEGIWGHVALFDARRVRQMVTDAGLVVHAVEPVANTWAFVLASHREGPSERASSAATRLDDVVASAEVDPTLPTKIRRIDASSDTVKPSRWTKRLERLALSFADGAVHCELVGGPADEDGGQYGGVSIPATAPRGIRIELGLDDIDSVLAFYVDAYAGEQRLARWKWDPTEGRPQRNPATFVLRPGPKGTNFRPVQSGDVSGADCFELFARITPGSTARFRLTRIAIMN